MAEKQLNLTATDIRVFVPVINFEQSLRFYTRLGWIVKWKDDENNLAELEMADSRFFLQNYYVKDWANNFMFQVTVKDAAAWHTHVSTILAEENFDYARLNPPKKESYGAITTHVWDPSGVLIHFSQYLEKA
ncbi:MAG: hypothetical protein Q9P44_17955 [Anaerolineae bacterium]|nr:hypothetical protein [Anaerolineae bacterium]